MKESQNCVTSVYYDYNKNIDANELIKHIITLI